MTFLTLEWQQLYADTHAHNRRNHPSLCYFLKFMAADARLPIMGVYDKFSAN